MPRVGRVWVDVVAKTAGVSAGLNKMAQDTKRATGEVKRELRESNGSLALLGDAFGVHLPRHVRTFVSSIQGVGTVMSSVFNGLAVFIVAKALYEAGEKAVEFAKKIREVSEVPTRLAEGFRKLNEPIEQSNRELDLSIARTENAIAKLEHKPQNKLAEAIAEAAVEAGKLNEKLEKGIEDSKKLLEKNNTGTFMRILTNATGTGQASDIAAYVEGELAKVPKDANYTSEVKRIRAEAENRIKYELEKNRRDAEAVKHQEGATFAGSNRGLNYANANAGLSQLLGAVQTMGESADLEERNDKDQAALKQREEMRDREAKQMKRWQDELLAIQTHFAEHGGKANEYEFWAARISQTEKGGDAWLDINRKIMEARLKTADEGNKAQAEFLKNSRIGPKLDNVTPDDSIAKDTLRALQIRQSTIGVQQQNADALALETIRYNEQAGAITRADAARQTVAEHTRQYTRDLLALQTLEESIRGDSSLTTPQKSIAIAEVQKQIEEINGKRGIQELQDRLSTMWTTAGDGMRNFFDEFRNEANDSAHQAYSVMSQAVNGINDNLSRLITGQKVQWSGFFQSLGQQAAKIGIQKLEAGVLSKLGIGKKKPTGAAGDPVHVHVESAASSIGGSSIGAIGKIGSSLGGVFGKAGGFLGKIFGGFFADGGNPDPYKTSIVGENGPELFSPGVSGHVSSNGDLRKMLGGSGGDTYVVDARGTNAAEVEMRVRSAVHKTREDAVASAMAMQRDRARRLPKSGG